MRRKEERETLKLSVLEQITKAVSQLGTCRRSKVGCIIVKNGRIISTGYNGSPPGEPHCTDIGCLMDNGHCVRTTHAESNAIAYAARHGISVEGGTIFVYGWITGGNLGICPSCDKLAKSAGIAKTVIVPITEADARKSEHIPGIKSRDHSYHDCTRMGCQTGEQR